MLVEEARHNADRHSCYQLLYENKEFSMFEERVTDSLNSEMFTLSVLTVRSDWSFIMLTLYWALPGRPFPLLSETLWTIHYIIANTGTYCWLLNENQQT